MWKVKRMKTARIVVLTIAVGAGGIAACRAEGSDGKSLQTDPVAPLQAPNSSDQGPNGDSFDGVRCGVSSLTGTQK
jgi:hypothetical protein